MFTRLIKKIRAFTPKQLMVAGVFTLALAGAVGGGMAVKQFASAQGQEIRDCGGSNRTSIDNQNLNGGCGALTAPELIADIRQNNPSDLQAIYADSRIGLTADKYDRFASDARPGVLKRNGQVWVDNQVVMENAWTMGRDNYPGREALSINNKTYYMAVPEISFADHRQELDVMVLFDKEGTVEVVIMEACGNPLPRGYKVPSSATCDKLNSHKVEGKDNTYTFTTNITLKGHAKVTKVEYFVDGQLWKTMPNGSDVTPELVITKDVEVSVKVHISLPGGNSKTIEFVEACKTKLKFDKIFYVCKELIASARDNTNRKFRFTVNHDMHKNVTLKDVDFTLDGKSTTTGVTDKDAQGRIYKDYDFTDSVKHKVSAKVKFTYNGQTVTAPEVCAAEVTPEKAPECPEKPGSGFPPGDERCKDKPKECPEKPGSGFPPGDARCKDVVLPKTGPGSVLGLFTGATIAGSAAHRLFQRRREQ